MASFPSFPPPSSVFPLTPNMVGCVSIPPFAFHFTSKDGSLPFPAIPNGDFPPLTDIFGIFRLLNIFPNLTESARFLRYITPFADGAELLTRGALDMALVLPGVAYAAAAMALAFRHYGRKDIH